MIPSVPDIEILLSGLAPLTVDESADSFFSVVLQPAVDERGEKSPGAVVRVSYDGAAKVSIEALIKRLSAELKRAGHPTTEAICELLLTLFALTRNRKEEAIPQFNQLLASIVNADLTQIFIFGAAGPKTYVFDAGDFHIGPLDFSMLSYRSSKAGSDYTDRYATRYRSAPLAITRKPWKVRVIAWDSYFRGNRAGDFHSLIPNLIYLLVDQYFFLTSASYFEQFLDSLKDAQRGAQAFGSGWLPVEELSRMIDTERLSIYLNIEGQNTGWVSPAQVPLISIDLGGAHIGVPTVQRELAARFGSSEDRAIDSVIATFTGFLATASEHQVHGRIADAILHHVIALDLLLGEKSSSTASVTKRAACLTCTAFSVSFAEMLKLCDEIYDVRSKYVHVGLRPNPEVLPKIERLSREVVLCLYRLRNQPSYAGAEFREAWVRFIQICIAKLEAGEPVDLEEFQRIGAAQPSDFSYDDLETIIRGSDSSGKESGS